MSEKSLPKEKILALLEEHPMRIATMTAGLAPAQLRMPPGPDEWSANEVLAHLRSCADMWGACIERMLAEHRPTIRAINPRTWIKETNYLELEFRTSLRAYTKQRAELLAVLKALPQKAWLREATITGAGKPLLRTVHFYAQWMATHERPHVKQIQRIVDRIHS